MNKLSICNDRMLITMHGFYRNKRVILPTNQPKKPGAGIIHMSIKDYKAILKRTHKKLFLRSFGNEYYYFITLTLTAYYPFDRVNTEFRRFLLNLKRHYGKPEYFRSIEYGRNRRFHIHAIIGFKEKPLKMDKYNIQKYWKLGIVNLKKVTDIYGVIQYMTKFKLETNRPDSKFTPFNKGDRVLASSNHFGVDCKKREIPITNKQLGKIISQFVPCNDKFVRFDYHKYFNQTKGTVDTCTDRIFIRVNSDDIKIINKFL